MSIEGDYSAVADEQLDAIEAGPDVELYNATLAACDLILSDPARARSLSTAITTNEGILRRLPVVGYPPYKVFWSFERSRIEAVLPHP